MATRSPNVCRKMSATAGVRAISGTSSSTPRPTAAHVGRQPQVELGLAAAGDAVQECGLKVAALDERSQSGQRGILFLGQDERRTFAAPPTTPRPGTDRDRPAGA